MLTRTAKPWEIPKVTTDPTDDRAAFIDGLVALACFLEAHPEAPVDRAYDGHTAVHVFPDGDTDADRRAAVDSAAASLGVTAAYRPGSRQYVFELQFGPFTYCVVAIDHETARLESVAPVAA